MTFVWVPEAAGIALTVTTLVTSIMIFTYRASETRNDRKIARLQELMKIETEHHVTPIFVYSHMSIDQPKVWQLADPVYEKYLNILDAIALDVKYKYVDEKKAKEHFELIFSTVYADGQQFIEALQEEQPTALKNFTDLAKKWQKRGKVQWLKQKLTQKKPQLRVQTK